MLVALIAPSLFILAYSAEMKQSRTYQDTVSHLCGPIIGKICQICISVASFGSGVAQLILIGDQLTDSKILVVAVVVLAFFFLTAQAILWVGAYRDTSISLLKCI